MKINEKTLLTFATSKPVDKEGYLLKRGEGETFLIKTNKAKILSLSRFDNSAITSYLSTDSKQSILAALVRSKRKFAFLLRAEGRRPAWDDYLRRMRHWACWGRSWKILLQHQLPRQPIVRVECRNTGSTRELDAGIDLRWLWLYEIDDFRVATTIGRNRQDVTAVVAWTRIYSAGAAAATKSIQQV